MKYISYILIAALLALNIYLYRFYVNECPSTNPNSMCGFLIERPPVETPEEKSI